MRLPRALNLNENPAQFGIFFSANRLTRLAKRGWQGAQASKSGSVASYMTPNHGKPWRLRNTASRDLGIGAVGRGFFHSLSGDCRKRIYGEVNAKVRLCPITRHHKVISVKEHTSLLVLFAHSALQ
uniref:Uncharacterized protein n=1 Tax=Candidatus Kentrum sp. FM TaxID=2126340 RepID=A0A450SMT0_9GAMM|nr:MAG: hypothetical protein BECKFM1743C_GA0114222_101511 [Candidatus Kentron sp. FM]